MDIPSEVCNNCLKMRGICVSAVDCISDAELEQQSVKTPFPENDTP